MTTYWFSDICSLFNSFEINPFSGPDKNFKYNSLTRLIILISVTASICTGQYMQFSIAGIISIILSLLIYFATFNKDMLYANTDQILKNIEDREFKNSSVLEKVILQDESTNKKNLQIVNFKPEFSTKSLARTYFLLPDTIKAQSEDLNLEKYNNKITEEITLGAKVINDILKKDVKNEITVSDVSF
jgi:hypothetical protein